MVLIIEHDTGKSLEIKKKTNNEGNIFLYNF